MSDENYQIQQGSNCGDDEEEAESYVPQLQINTPGPGPLVSIAQVPSTSQTGSGLPTTKIRLKGIPTSGKSDGTMQQTTKITIFGAGRRPSAVSSYTESMNTCDDSFHHRQNIDSRDLKSPRNRICMGEASQRIFPQNSHANILHHSDAHSQRVLTADGPPDGTVTYSQAVEKEIIDPIDARNKKVRLERQITTSPHGTVLNETLMGACIIKDQRQQQQYQQLPHCLRLAASGKRALEPPSSRSRGPIPISRGPSPNLQEPCSRYQQSSSPRFQEDTTRLQQSCSRFQEASARFQEARGRLQELSSRQHGPSPRQQDPCSRFQDASPRFQETSARSQEACSGTQEASQRVQQPSAQFQQASPRFQEVTTRQQESSPRLQEPCSRFQEASSRFQEASARSQEASQRSQQPCSRFQEASPRQQEASQRSQQPSLRFQEADPRFQEASPRQQEISQTSQQPCSRFQGPDPRFQEASPRQQEANQRSQQPCSGFQETSSRFQEASPRQQEVSPRSQQPCSRFQEADPRFQEAFPRQQEASQRLQQPSSRFQEASPRFQEAGSRSQEPCSSTQEASQRLQQSYSRLQEASPRQQEPCSRLQKPSSRYEDVQSKLQASLSRLRGPCSKLQSPQSRLQAPQSRLQAPQLRLQAPQSRLQAPQSRLQAPQSGLQAPQSRLQAPQTRQAPQSRLQAPQTRQAPQSRLQAPETTQARQAPQSRIQAPQSRVQAPRSKLVEPQSRLQAPQSRLQGPCTNLQTSRSRLQTPISRLQMPSCSSLQNTRLQEPQTRMKIPSSRLQQPCSSLPTSKSRLQAPQTRGIHQMPQSKLQIPQTRNAPSTSYRQQEPLQIKSESSSSGSQSPCSESPKSHQSEKSIKVPTPLPDQTHIAAAAADDVDLLNKSYIPKCAADATIDEIKKLIEEEKRDVLQSQTLSPDLATKLKQLKKKTLLEETLQETISTLNVDEGEDTSSPVGGSDVLASLMHSEERGVINTVSSPKRMYDALFGASGALEVALEDERSVAVSPAAPSPLNDIVVPVGEASQDEVAVLMPEIEYQVAQTDQEIPKADAYSESIQQGQSLPQVGPTKRESNRRNSSQMDADDVGYIPRGELEEQKAPWDIDLGSLEDLVGGQLSMISAGERLPSDESIRATLQRFEFILDVEKPKNYSCVQLRGTQRPHWFPGYFFVHPENTNTSMMPNQLDNENYVRLEQDPSKVFAQVWKIFQPNNLRGNSEIVIL